MLLSYIDLLALPSKSLLKFLTQNTHDEKEKLKLSDIMERDYNDYIFVHQRTLLEVLKAFPSIKPPLGHLLELLPRLSHRLYSISSSLLACPNQVHVTAIVTKYETKAKRIHLGVCTTWLADAKQIPNGTENLPKVPIFLRASGFSLPKEPTTPIIMIGPGTGLAPFRGFLQHRAALKTQGKEIGESILFFGCRNPDIDYIYKTELDQYLKDNVITQLLVAFSRLLEEKQYVQHLMLQPQTMQKLWNLLSETDAHFYVCGEARNMATGVRTTLLDIIQKCGNKNLEEAEAFIKTLETSNRYLLDVWS